MLSPVSRYSHTLGVIDRASLLSQMVKNPPVIQENWVLSLGQKEAREKKWLFTPVFLPGESHGQRSLANCSPWGHKESDTTEQLSTHTRKSHMDVGQIADFQYFTEKMFILSP